MSIVKKIVWLINLTALLLWVTSCTNVQTKNNDKQDGTDSDTSDATIKYYASVVFLLPSPGDILERFYGASIKYNPAILNSPDNKDKYIGSKAQSLNLGVYITDMAYSALFERSAETIIYLEVIQSLSTESGISSNIFESLLTRSKANAGKIDSLISISDEAFSNMLEFLESGGKENTIALISAGSYIESLNIALQSIPKYSKDDEMLKLLADMKYPMDNLLEKAKSAKLSETDNSIINYLNQISIIFNELETRSSKTVVSEKKAGEISISGGEQVIMNEAEFNTLKSRVSEIRKNIVSF
jgi:hypothetical protein